MRAHHRVSSDSSFAAAAAAAAAAGVPADSCCCLDICRTKEHIRIATSSFCGRRAMVNKLWCRELVLKWYHAKIEPPHPRCFTEPKCQDKLEAWYLVYRWLIFSLWLSILLCSVLEIGSANPLWAWEKWPIYLTNWDLALGLSQSFLGAILVTRRWKLQNIQDFDVGNLHYGKLEKFYWVLYVVTSSLAFGVTVTYWGLVHDPKIHQVDLLNILIHVNNSILMLVDFCVTGVPFELRCFWWCPALVSFYLVFTLVYYTAGGLDKRGQPRIYNVLDWEKPVKTLLVCAGGLTFLVLMHCLLYFLSRFRDRVYDRRRKGANNHVDKAIDAARRKNESCV